MTNLVQLRAYFAGLEAAYEGASPIDNPYAFASEREAWDLGFYDWVFRP
jgi:hypothetical protein